MSRAWPLRGVVLAAFCVVVACGPAVAAERFPQKQARPACDQAALTTYDAYFAARRAVNTAFHDAKQAANDAFRVTMTTGTKAEKKSAPRILQRARADARANFDRAIAALGPPPTKPLGCRATKS